MDSRDRGKESSIFGGIMMFAGVAGCVAYFCAADAFPALVSIGIGTGGMFCLVYGFAKWAGIIKP